MLLVFGYSLFQEIYLVQVLQATKKFCLKLLYKNYEFIVLLILI